MCILKGIALLTLMALFLCSSAAAQDRHYQNQGLQQLQWALQIPDKHWHEPMQALAQHAESGAQVAATQSLKLWLEQSVDNAMLALPHMSQFFFYLDAYYLADVYAEHLARMGVKESMHKLGVLGLHQQAIEIVGQRVLVLAWQQNSAAFASWLQQTPGFFADVYLDNFVYSKSHSLEDFERLAAMFYALPPSDYRQSRYFNLTIEQWILWDARSAIAYVADLQKHDNTRDKDALNKISATIAYYLNGQQDHVQALSWLDKVNDKDIRDPSFRDFCLSLTNEAHIPLFKAWMQQHPISTAELNRDIQIHFESLLSQHGDNKRQAF